MNVLQTVEQPSIITNVSLPPVQTVTQTAQQPLFAMDVHQPVPLAKATSSVAQPSSVQMPLILPLVNDHAPMLEKSASTIIPLDDEIVHKVGFPSHLPQEITAITAAYELDQTKFVAESSLITEDNHHQDAFATRENSSLSQLVEIVREEGQDDDVDNANFEVDNEIVVKNPPGPCKAGEWKLHTLPISTSASKIMGAGSPNDEMGQDVAKMKATLDNNSGQGSSKNLDNFSDAELKLLDAVQYFDPRTGTYNYVQREDENLVEVPTTMEEEENLVEVPTTVEEDDNDGFQLVKPKKRGRLRKNKDQD